MSPTPGTLGVVTLGGFSNFVFRVCSGVRFCADVAELQSGFVIFGLIFWIRSAHAYRPGSSPSPIARTRQIFLLDMVNR
jgi:hypothetical protein